MAKKTVRSKTVSPKSSDAPKPKRIRKSKPTAVEPVSAVAVMEEPIKEFLAEMRQIDADTQLKPTNESIVLIKRLTEKSGLTSYARHGVRSSVYFSKAFFNTLPAEVTFTAPAGTFATASDKKTVDPDVVRLKALQLKERAEKARIRAEKATARAAKLVSAVQ